MTIKTKSEFLFEGFCTRNDLKWKPIPTGTGKTPDYRLCVGATEVAVEIKQIQSLEGFNPGGVSSRTPGMHVRKMIHEASGQLQAAAKSGMPGILLIYNAVDPWQSFGTEQHDFINGMYGDLTVRVVDGKFGKPFHGRNAKMRTNANTSFGAVGHLSDSSDIGKITIYENVYAAHPIPFDDFPACIELVRVEIIDAA